MLLLVFIVFTYGAAWLAYQRGRIFLSLGIIIFAGLGLRIFCALDPMLHPWDERYHALVAKNMMSDPFHPKLYAEPLLDYDFKNWTANKTWLHKQPLPLWTMALSMKIFGVSEFTLRLPSVLLSTLSIFLTFWIGRFLSDSDRVGLIAAFLLSINGLVIELASGRVSTDHVDTFFMFWITLSVFFILHNFKQSKTRWLIFSGIACGFAILTKWLPALIIFPLYLIINFKNKSILKLFSELALMGLVTILIALPWQVYAYSIFPLEYTWEQYYNALHLTEGLEGHGQPWWYFIDRIRMTINELIYLVFGWFLYQIIKEKTKRKAYLFLLAWILIPFVVFSLAATKMQGYLLFTFPAWTIIIGIFLEHLWTANPKSMVLKKFYLLLIGVVFFLAFRYGLERIKPFEKHTSEKVLKEELLRTTYPPKTILFNTKHPIEWMFYNDGIAYPVRPKEEVIDSLRQKGWLIY